MFATIKSLIPEPRQTDQPRHYVGRHRRPEPAPVPVSPAPGSPGDEPQPQRDTVVAEAPLSETAEAPAAILRDTHLGNGAAAA